MTYSKRTPFERAYLSDGHEKHFSDDEGGVDEPLAPLPDEPEVIEGDEEVELDETQNSTMAAKTVESTPAPLEEPLSKPTSPKPQLSLTVIDDPVNGDENVLDASLKPLDDAEMQDIEKKVDVESVVPGVELDLSALGPDGLGLDEPHDLSQMDAADGLVGGPLLDETVDPFAQAPP